MQLYVNYRTIAKDPNDPRDQGPPDIGAIASYCEAPDDSHNGCPFYCQFIVIQPADIVLSSDGRTATNTRYPDLSEMKVDIASQQLIPK